MTRARWPRRLALATWATATAGFALSSGCSVPHGFSQLDLPDRDQFAQSVSPFMEQRCGTLDCHGQIGRPLRIYSTNGLRKSQGVNGARDDSPTHPDERLANYFSVVGLEPEDVTASKVTQGADADFLLLKKPLGIEGGGVRHKGGAVLRATDPGYQCLALWIAGPDKFNAEKCTEGMLR